MSDCTIAVPEEWRWLQISPELIARWCFEPSPAPSRQPLPGRCRWGLKTPSSHLIPPPPTCGECVSDTVHHIKLILGTVFITRPLPLLKLHHFDQEASFSLLLIIFLSRYNCCRICTTGTVSSWRIKDKWNISSLKCHYEEKCIIVGSWF